MAARQTTLNNESNQRQSVVPAQPETAAPQVTPKLEPEIVRARRRKVRAALPDTPEEAPRRMCSEKDIQIDGIDVYKGGDGYFSLSGHPDAMIAAGYVCRSWFGGRRSKSGRWLSTKKLVVQSMKVETSISEDGECAYVRALPIGWGSPLNNAIETERRTINEMLRSRDHFRATAMQAVRFHLDRVLIYVDQQHDGYFYSDEVERKVRKAIVNIEHHIRRGWIGFNAKAHVETMTDIRLKRAKANEPFQKALSAIVSAVADGKVVNGAKEDCDSLRDDRGH